MEYIIPAASAIVVAVIEALAASAAYNAQSRQYSVTIVLDYVAAE